MGLLHLSEARVRLRSLQPCMLHAKHACITEAHLPRTDVEFLPLDACLRMSGSVVSGGGCAMALVTAVPECFAKRPHFFLFPSKNDATRSLRELQQRCHFATFPQRFAGVSAQGECIGHACKLKLSSRSLPAVGM